MPKKLSKVPLPEDIAERYREFSDMLNETKGDLPRALLVHNFLDRALASVIRRTLVKGSRTTTLLDPKRGVIGSYGARTQLVHCLGLVSDNCKDNLGILGDIRNHFAHSADKPTFDDKEVKELCDQLIPPSVPTGKDGAYVPSWIRENFTPEMNFTMVCMFIVYELQEIGKTLTHATKSKEQQHNVAWIKPDSE